MVAISVDTDDCWLWARGVDKGDYGKMGVDGKPRNAHRVIYEALVGEIPDGYEIDHLCRIHRCINPEHLEAVTHQENIKRGKSGQEREYCSKGIHLMEEHARYNNNNSRACYPCMLAQQRERYRKLKLNKD